MTIRYCEDCRMYTTMTVTERLGIDPALGQALTDAEIVLVEIAECYICGHKYYRSLR